MINEDELDLVFEQGPVLGSPSSNTVPKEDICKHESVCFAVTLCLPNTDAETDQQRQYYKNIWNRIIARLSEGYHMIANEMHFELTKKGNVHVHCAINMILSPCKWVYLDKRRYAVMMDIAKIVSRMMGTSVPARQPNNMRISAPSFYVTTATYDVWEVYMNKENMYEVYRAPMQKKLSDYAIVSQSVDA